MGSEALKVEREYFCRDKARRREDVKCCLAEQRSRLACIFIPETGVEEK